MQQKDMEKFAFLYMCGQEDRDLLNGKKRMTFQDFNSSAPNCETREFLRNIFDIFDEES